MVFLVLLIWQSLSSLVVSASPSFSLTVIPADQPVYLGQRVILTCQVQGVKLPLNYSVLFKRENSVISEKCQAYQESKYHLECVPNDWRQATTYKLHIKSVSWADRGSWFCIYAASLTSQHLDVYAPAAVKQMGVTSLDIVSGSAATKSSNSNDPSKPGASQSALVESPAASSSSGRSVAPPAHVGFGTRTNPYDLRPGLGLQLTCETMCGYPDANISWLIVNKTHTKPRLTTAGPNLIRTDSCGRSATTRTMSTTKSVLNVRCVDLELVGLNEVQCAVTGRQYMDHTPERHVHVLCPDERGLEELRLLQNGRTDIYRRGERPLYLTNGEVVGIAVGAAIALILIFIACLVLRNNRKESPLPIAVHFPGQRV